MSRGHHQRPASRRAFLAGTAGLGLAATAPAHAQQRAAEAPAPARVKGPAVWLDLDQKALDDAYDQSVYAPNQKHVSARRNVMSQQMRALYRPERHAYGASEIEKLDIYRTKRRNAPINIYIHGGAWRSGLAKDNATAAEMFVKAGAHHVVLDFINVIEANGDLMPMLDQIRRGIAWVGRNARRLGGDPGRIYISGFSSGAHLGGVVTITDWKKEFGLPANLVKGALLCSGMYDLKPVRLSARSRYVKFTDAMEDALSTQRHLERIGCPIVLAHGTLETPEFQRQSREFAVALKAAGKPAELIVGEGYNHFEMAETLANPYGILGRAALNQMKLA